MIDIGADESLCSNLKTFLTKLEQMRKSDDIIVVALNNELPTKSFPGCEKSRKTCGEFLLKAKSLEQCRNALIDKCLTYYENKISSAPEHELRSIRGTIRQIKGQKDVEEIVSSRTNKAIMERCDRLV